jgi:hypothetical protein
MSRGVSAQKRSQWRERFRRFAQSKLPVTEFCRRERVSAASFYRWRPKLADSAAKGPTRCSPPAGPFLPVEVARATGLQVDFPNGARLTLPVSEPELVKMSIDTIAQAQTRKGDV